MSEDVYTYNEEQRSYYALNVAVTADNYQEFTDSLQKYMSRYPNSWMRKNMRKRKYG